MIFTSIPNANCKQQMIILENNIKKLFKKLSYINDLNTNTKISKRNIKENNFLTLWHQVYYETQADLHSLFNELKYTNKILEKQRIELREIRLYKIFNSLLDRTNEFFSFSNLIINILTKYKQDFTHLVSYKEMLESIQLIEKNLQNTNKKLPFTVNLNNLLYLIGSEDSKITLKNFKLDLQIQIPIVLEDNFFLYKAFPIPVLIKTVPSIISPQFVYGLIPSNITKFPTKAIQLTENERMSCRKLLNEYIICKQFRPSTTLNQIDDLESFFSPNCTFKDFSSPDVKTYYFCQLNKRSDILIVSHTFPHQTILSIISF